MSIQLLCRLDGGDAATISDALMNDAEDQSNAGLSRLQLWHDAETAGRVWILFDVRDRGRAQGWLDRAVADTHGARAGVTGSAAHWLKTA